MFNLSFSRRRFRLNFWEGVIFGLPILLGLALWIGWRLRPPAAIDSFAPPREIASLTFAPDSSVVLVQTYNPSPVVGGISTMIPEVTAYATATGTRLWRAPQGESATDFAPQGHDVLLQSPSFLARRDAKTGVDTWKVAISQSFDFSFAADGKYVRSWLEIRDSQNGSSIYNHPTSFSGRQVFHPFWPRLVDERHLRFCAYIPTDINAKIQNVDVMEIYTVDILTNEKDVFRLPFFCRNVELSRDSRYGVFLAMAKNPRNNTLQLWDIEQRKRLQQWPAPNTEQLFAWARGKSKLEFYANDSESKNETPRVFTDGSNLSKQALKSWAPDEQQYIPNDQHALVVENEKLSMRDRVTGKVLRQFPSNVIHAAVSPDHKWFATAERTKKDDYSSPVAIRIWPAD